MLTVAVSELPAWIELAARSKNNVLIVGDPGVGKSQVIGGMAGENCKVTMMTGSSTIEEYVNGIPTPQSTTMPDGKELPTLKYVAPQWLAEMIVWQIDHPTGRQVLFLDEFNTADPQVLKTFLTILTERRIPTIGLELPENTVIVAAMNPQDQNEGEPLIRPMASRFMTLQITSTLDTYKAYLKGQDTCLSGKLPTILEQPSTLDPAAKVAFVNSISTKEWGNYDEKSGHEINPRSMSNFFRALEYVKDQPAMSPNLSRAFLGVGLTFPDLSHAVEQKVQPKTKNGVPYLTKEQIVDLTDSELQSYYQDISKPNITGAEAIKSRAIARNALRARGLL